MVRHIYLLKSPGHKADESIPAKFLELLLGGWDFLLEEVECEEPREVADSSGRSCGQRTMPEHKRMATSVDLASQHGQSSSALNLYSKETSPDSLCSTHPTLFQEGHLQEFWSPN